MNFGPAVKSVFSKYATFSGRATRSEYWYWYLFCILCQIATAILDALVFHAPVGDNNVFHPLNTIFMLVTILPSLAVAVRRLHDVNRRGWWLLISLTAIGILFPLLYWFCKKGNDGTNNYGPNVV